MQWVFNTATAASTNIMFHVVGQPGSLIKKLPHFELGVNGKAYPMIHYLWKWNRIDCSPYNKVFGAHLKSWVKSMSIRCVLLEWGGGAIVNGQTD